MEALAQSIRDFKLVMKILSILLLFWAVFSKMDGMDGVANILLFLSGSISCFILIGEYIYRRLVKRNSNLEGFSIDEFINSVRKLEESIKDIS